MKELHIEGRLGCSSDGNSIVARRGYRDEKIQLMICHFFAEDEYYCGENEGDLGGELCIVQNVSIQIYFSKHKCTIEEAKEGAVLSLFGELHNDIEFVGYSEYTITGYNCEEFTIGGHDLDKELRGHLGEYMHLIIAKTDK